MITTTTRPIWRVNELITHYSLFQCPCVGRTVQTFTTMYGAIATAISLVV